MRERIPLADQASVARLDVAKQLRRDLFRDIAAERVVYIEQSLHERLHTDALCEKARERARDALGLDHL